MPLCLRRKQLQANYWVNLMDQRDDHPVKVARSLGERGERGGEFWMDRGESGTIRVLSSSAVACGTCMGAPSSKA